MEVSSLRDRTHTITNGKVIQGRIALFYIVRTLKKKNVLTMWCNFDNRTYRNQSQVPLKKCTVEGIAFDRQT